jgi:hypothetical protein
MTAPAWPDHRRRRPFAPAPAFLFFLALVLILPAGAVAQTNDVYFRSWDWTPDLASARALGVAGATVALADDSAGLESNPASLASLERTELTAALAARGAGSTRAGDHLAARASLGQAGIAARLGARWTIGAFFLEPNATRMELAPDAASDGTRDMGGLRTTTADLGGELGLRLARRLHLGARVTVTHLSLQAEAHRAETGQLPWLSVGTGGGASAATVTAGVLIEVSRSLRVGAAYAPAVSWELRRTATSPRLGLNLDTGSAFLVTRPGVLSAGLTWRPSPRLLGLLQIDDLRAPALSPGLPGGYAALAHHLRATCVRTGVEVSWPVGSFALQARAGIVLPGPDPRTQVVLAPSPDAPGPSDAAILWQPFKTLDLATGLWQRAPRSSFDASAADRRAVTGGLSLATRAGLRLDIAAHVGRRQTLVALGVALRL